MVETTVASAFRGVAHDDVEFGAEFTGFAACDGGEGDGDGGLMFFGAEVFPDAVFGVAGVVFDVTLSGPFFAALHFDGEVDVRGAAWIGDGFDGAEDVFAGGAGEEAAERLEVFVFFGDIAAAAGVAVDPGAVALPDFDEGVADGLAVWAEDAAAEPCDLADGWGGGVVDDEEIVIGVERERVRVERAFGLGRRLEEGFGEGAGDGPEGGGSGGGAAEEVAAAGEEGFAGSEEIHDRRLPGRRCGGQGKSGG